MDPAMHDSRCRVGRGRGFHRRAGSLCMAALWAVSAAGQTNPGIQQVLDRLDRLELQNRELIAKVETLQAEIATLKGGAAEQGTAKAAPAAGSPTIEERTAVLEARTAEQAQSKVEASERFPIRITGMALFNAYRNSAASGGSAFPTYASAGGASGGATFQQTVLGLDFFGPRTFWGGRVSGALRMDFYGGSGRGLDQDMRLRTAAVAIDWKNRGLRAALDKPIIAVRQPESLAQVGVSPLTGAGDLWLWLPQASFEQEFHIGAAGVRAQIAAVQTREAASVYGGYNYGGATPSYATAMDRGRPGLEARLEFFSGSGRRIEIAPGLHHSVAHAAGGSAPTDIYSVDWLLRPAASIDFTGSAFSGTNTAALGGLQQGVVVLAPGRTRAVHSAGGWGQLTWRALPRLWFNLFSGEEDPRNADLPAGTIGRNLAFGGNLFFQIAPNVLTSFEVHQYRTSYLHAGLLLSNHYDLALAYRF
jgi:hypothetical protein